MGLRAYQSVYWPGLWDDLDRVRNSCRTCVKIAPSQANLPPIDPITPEYPFQHIYADFFMLDVFLSIDLLGGQEYLLGGLETMLPLF